MPNVSGNAARRGWGWEKKEPLVEVSRGLPQPLTGVSSSEAEERLAARIAAEAAGRAPPPRSWLGTLSNSVSGALGAAGRFKNSAVGVVKTIAYGSPEEQKLQNDLKAGAERNAELDRVHAEQMAEKKAAANAEQVKTAKAAANAAAAEAAAKSSQKTKDAYNGWLESVIRDAHLEPVFEEYEPVEKSHWLKSHKDLHAKIYANPVYIKAYEYWKPKHNKQLLQERAEEQEQAEKNFRARRAVDPRYAPSAPLYKTSDPLNSRTRRDPKKAFVNQLIAPDRGWDATTFPGKLVHPNLVGTGYMIIDINRLPDVPRIDKLSSYIKSLSEKEYSKMLQEVQEVKDKRNLGPRSNYLYDPYSKNASVNPFSGEETYFPKDDTPPPDIYTGDPDRPYTKWGGKSRRHKSRKSQKSQSRKHRKQTRRRR